MHSRDTQGACHSGSWTHPTSVRKKEGTARPRRRGRCLYFSLHALDPSAHVHKGRLRGAGSPRSLACRSMGDVKKHCQWERGAHVARKLETRVAWTSRMFMRWRDHCDDDVGGGSGDLVCVDGAIVLRARSASSVSRIPYTQDLCSVLQKAGKKSTAEQMLAS